MTLCARQISEVCKRLLHQASRDLNAYYKTQTPITFSNKESEKNACVVQILLKITVKSAGRVKNFAPED